MKIRTKLLISFIFIALLATGLATFAAIVSISNKYGELAVEEAVNTRKQTENFFFDYMGELSRKATFLSELSEVVNNMDKPEELTVALETKTFFLSNVVIRAISPEAKPIAVYDNFSESYVNEALLKSLPFFKGDRDPLMRDAGIFKIKDTMCMLVLSPVIDPESFSLKGYILLELYFNAEFADYLKEKAQGDVVVRTDEGRGSSTYLDGDGNRYIPHLPDITPREIEHMEVENKNVLVSGFPVMDHFDKRVGFIYVIVNVKKIMSAKQQGIHNILAVLGIVGLVVLAASFLIGKKLTDSITQLADASQALARGEFDVHLEDESNDEIGQLTVSFNRMTESLKKQRDEIMALKLYFERIIENSPSAIIICDVVSHAITINPAAEKLFNIDKKEIEGKEIFEIINLPLSLQADFYQVILSGNPVSYDSYRLTLDGQEERVFRLTFYEVSLKDSESVAIQVEDVTKSLRLEAELTHAQKLGTLGEVLGRFTHEFNNLMTGILGHVSLLLRAIPKDDQHYHRIKKVDELATKARDLGKNILSFSKKGKMETERVDVQSLIDSVLNLVEKTVFKDICIQKAFPREPFFTMANKEKLSLALLNLMINAKDAVRSAKRGRDGTITISLTRELEADTDKKFLEINVSDNGTGIKDNIIKKIFEPYFTTKGTKGTGLGLATVKDIVEKSGGTIHVESVPDKGTTFTLRFPEVE